MELARNLKVESVSRLKPGPFVVLPGTAAVRDAVERMNAARVGCALVVNAGGELIGIFSERDLIRRVLAIGASLDTPLTRCMTRDPRTADPHEPVGVAAQRMVRGGYRHLPVIDDSMRPVGVLSSRGVVHYLVEHFPSTIYCLPPDPDVFPLHREGA